MLQHTTSYPPKHTYVLTFMCICLLLHITYMCYNICRCVLTYLKLFFLLAFPTFQNHTQKLRALLTEIQHTRCCAPSLRFPSRPRIILTAVGCSTSRWSLSIILFICSGCRGTAVLPGSHSSCEWQLYIQ